VFWDVSGFGSSHLLHVRPRRDRGQGQAACRHRGGLLRRERLQGGNQVPAAQAGFREREHREGGQADELQEAAAPGRHHGTPEENGCHHGSTTAAGQELSFKTYNQIQWKSHINPHSTFKNTWRVGTFYIICLGLYLYQLMTHEFKTDWH